MNRSFFRRATFISTLALILAYSLVPCLSPGVHAAQREPGSAEPTQAPASDELKAKLKDAWDKFTAKDNAGALKILDEAIAKEPHPFAYYTRGRVRYVMNDHQGALDDVDQAIRKGGPTTAMLMLRGRLYVKMKQYDKGAADYALVVQHSTTEGAEKNVDAVRHLGIALFCKGGDDETAANFLAIAIANAEDPESKLYDYYFLWCLHARQGKQQLWVDELKKGVDAEEKRLNAEEADANASLPETARPAPGSVPSAASKSWSLKVGRYLGDDLSEADLLAAAKDPNADTTANQLCEAHYYIGMKHLGKGHRDDAVSHLNEAVATKAVIMMEYMLAEAELLQIRSPAKPPVPPSPAI